MGQVLIRNLDDEIIAAYRDAAERNNRSLEAELREALKLHRPIAKKRREELRALSDAIRALTPTGVKQTASEVLVREDRDGFRY